MMELSFRNISNLAVGSILFAEATTAKICWTTGCIPRKDCRSQLLSTQRRVCPCIRGTWRESSNGGEREKSRKASVSTLPIMFSIMFTIMFPMDFCSLIKIKKRKKVTGFKDEDEQDHEVHAILNENWTAINIRWINETTPPNFEKVLKPFFLNTHLKFKIPMDSSVVYFFIKILLLDGMNCQ